MGWLRKRKGKGEALGEAKHSATAQKIADRILSLQTKCAFSLDACAQKLGMRNTKILIGALMVCFAFYCAWLVIGAMR